MPQSRSRSIRDSRDPVENRKHRRCPARAADQCRLSGGKPDMTRTSRKRRFWHFASVIAARYFGRYWGHSGHWSAGARDGSVANDPNRTLASNLLYRLTIRFLLRYVEL